MQNKEDLFDVAIIGGSYAGLSAAMALGRSLRKVAVFDGGKPANRQTPHAHNFLTHDGASPAQIASQALEQVLAYPTIRYFKTDVRDIRRNEAVFTLENTAGDRFRAKKILLAGGLEDVMPPVPGFAECWGISVIHCPYCHGYEVRGQKTAVLANGDIAAHFVPLVYKLTQDIVLLTNGPAHLNDGQRARFARRGITLMETPLSALEHDDGRLRTIRFQDGSALDVPVLYAKLPTRQASPLPKNLGCALDEQGFVITDEFQKTNIPGVYAAGDMTTPMRALANAIAQGGKAGAMLNMELCGEEF